MARHRFDAIVADAAAAAAATADDALDAERAGLTIDIVEHGAGQGGEEGDAQLAAPLQPARSPGGTSAASRSPAAGTAARVSLLPRVLQ